MNSSVLWMFLGPLWKEAASQRFNTQTRSGPYYRNPCKQTHLNRSLFSKRKSSQCIWMSSHNCSWASRIPALGRSGTIVSASLACSFHCSPFQLWLHSFLSSLNQVALFDTSIEFPKVRSLPKIALPTAKILHLLKKKKKLRRAKVHTIIFLKQ